MCEGFSYLKRQVRDGVSYWACRHASSKGCRSRGVYYEAQQKFVLTRPEHACAGILNTSGMELKYEQEDDWQ